MENRIENFITTLKYISYTFINLLKNYLSQAKFIRDGATRIFFLIKNYIFSVISRTQPFLNLRVIRVD